MTLPRKDAILAAAGDQFGRFGFRGASLRDIASEAGVSLTLLRHHFGSKGDLMRAVVDAQRPLLEERIAMLRQVTSRGAGTFDVKTLVDAWIRTGFDSAARDQGPSYVRLLSRVIDEPVEDAELIGRDSLDEAALLFTDALHQCCPDASRRVIASAYIWVNASLLKFLEGSHRVFRLVEAEDTRHADGEDARRLARFLVAGVEALLRDDRGPATRHVDASDDQDDEGHPSLDRLSQRATDLAA